MSESNGKFCIRTQGLRRAFEGFWAVDGIDLEVPKGSFYGFLGPNGAGKTTTIQMLIGLLAPTAGRVHIFGLNPFEHAMEVKRRIGVVPEGLALFQHLTGREQLWFSGRMYGLDRETIETRSEELLDLMELNEKADEVVGAYSHGMRKKLALSCALLHDPDLLFLDEPFEGIDAIHSRRIRELLQTLLNRGVTIFLTSHILEIVERLCTDVAIIHLGKLIAQGPLDELKAGIMSEEGERRTLEEIFISLVGEETRERTLSWIGERSLDTPLQAPAPAPEPGLEEEPAGAESSSGPASDEEPAP